MTFPELPPLVDFRKMPWAVVPPASPACRSMLMAAALASDAGSGPGLTWEILRVPWPVSCPDTSHALNAVLRDTTFRPALFVPPSAARLKTATWSPGVFDVDLALTATPEETITETGLVMDPSFSIRFIQAIRLPTPVGRAPLVQPLVFEQAPEGSRTSTCGKSTGRRRRMPL